MKSTVLAIAAVLAVTTAGAANAAVFVTSTFGAPDLGPRTGETLIIDFDDGLGGLEVEAGVTLAGDYSTTDVSVGGVRAAPALDKTFYLSVPDTVSNGSATMSFDTFLGGRGVRKFSFYWGSIDNYNDLELLDKDGATFYTLNGLSIPPANGDQGDKATNRRVNFYLTDDSVNLGGLKFKSTQYAFETDTFSFAVVPEPGTWALMILGFGGAGAMLRRSRRLVAA